MEWKYRNTVITVNKYGQFEYEVANHKYSRDTLEGAKQHINDIEKEYYTISEVDIKKILESLHGKHREFVDALLKEVRIHSGSVECDLGILMDFDYSDTHYFKKS